MPLSNESTSPTPPPFPESVWRGAICDYYNLICNTTEASDSLIWAAITSVMSALAATCVCLPWAAEVVRPILFFCLLGQTSRARKTTAISDAIHVALEPLRPRAMQPGEPDPFEIVRGHGSGEGLMEALADRSWYPPGANRARDPANVQTGRTVYYVLDEFGALLEKAAREAAGNFTAFALQLFDAQPSMALSTRSNKLTCTDAKGTIIAASTYDYFTKNLTDSLVHSGFLNRFLFVTGGRTAPIPIRPPVDPGARDALVQRLRTTMTALRGQEMRFCADAQALHNQLYSTEFYRDDESPLVAAATDRNGTTVVRLAMTLAFAEGMPVITPEHVQAAWDFMAYSRQVVDGLLGQMKDRTFEQAEAKMVRACRRTMTEGGGPFTRADIRDRLHGGNGLTSRNFTVTWDALLSAGDVLPLPATDPNGEPKYVLAPHHAAQP